MVKINKYLKYKENIINYFDYRVSQINNKNTSYLHSKYSYLKKNYFNLLKKKKILECCCGDGNISLELSKYSERVIGIDFSKISIEIAKEKSKKNKKIKFFVMDVHNLKFSKNSFDVIFCVNSLLYLDLDKFITQINFVLNPQGKLIIVETLSNNIIFKTYRFLKNIFTNNLDLRKFSKQIDTLKISDLAKLKNKDFNVVDEKFFDFFTILSNLIYNFFKIKINIKFVQKLDKLFLNNFFFKYFAHSVVLVLEKK